MRIPRWSAAPALAGLLLASSACVIIHPQRIDNLAAAECRAQMQYGIEQMLVARRERPDVARTLAASAVDKMQADVADQPRQGSHLAADLRILTSRASVASSSGTIYLIFADRVDNLCALRLETGEGRDLTYAVTACTCVAAQDIPW